MIRPLGLLLAAIALGGCRSQYRVELWNDTGHAVDVGIVEQHAEVTRDDRHVTVSPDGWFDYSIENGERCSRRFVRLRVRDVEATTDVDITESQFFRGRAILTGAQVTVVPMSRPESDERRRRK